MSSDQLIAAVETVKSNLSKSSARPPGKPDVSQLLKRCDGARYLRTAVSQALSAANVAKIKTDVDALMKQFLIRARSGAAECDTSPLSERGPRSF